MQKEFHTLRENGTWTLVPRPKEKKVLSNRWVFKTKTDQNGKIEKHKARLVARGHVQRLGIDFEEAFAPVARYETIRTLLAAAVNDEMHIHQMDVISAYVQGELHDEIYMEQPEMFVDLRNEDKVCKLLRPLHGLKQSGREWYRKLDDFILTIGGKRTPADPCVYVIGEGEDRVILVIYVDDLIFASKNIKQIQSVKSLISSTFKMTDLGPISSILGINVEREGPTEKIRLSQKKYINDLLEEFNMIKAKTVSTPIEPNIKISKNMCPVTIDERKEMENCPYRELIGSLIYLANATRPDIAFAASTLSRFCSNPGREHWLFAKRILRYLKMTSDYGITYVKSDEKLKAFSDSDWAGDIDDRRSCLGNVLTLASAPISLKSKKQKSVTLSTMEAEYAALSEVSREIVYIKRLLMHMGFEKYTESPIDVFCDNQSAIELSKMQYIINGVNI